MVSTHSKADLEYSDDYRTISFNGRCLAAWLFDHGDGYGQPAAPITSAVLGRTINGYIAGNEQGMDYNSSIHAKLAQD